MSHVTGRVLLSIELDPATRQDFVARAYAAKITQAAYLAHLMELDAPARQMTDAEYLSAMRESDERIYYNRASEGE